MKMRDFLNNNSALVTILAVVILVISLGVIIMNTRGPGAIRAIDLYFYDVSNGQLFVASSDQIPPIDTAGGANMGVRAHVFACGECPSDLAGLNAEQVKQKGAYIAYLEMYTPQGKQALTAASQGAAAGGPEGGQQGPPPEAMIDPMQQTLVKRAEDPNDKWLSMYSPQGYQLTDQSVSQCPDGSPARACRP